MEEKDIWLKDNGFDSLKNPFDIMIVDACWKNNIKDPSLIGITIAISRLETAHYKSFVAKNNFGGMVNSAATRERKKAGQKGTVWYTYSTQEAGINAFVSNLNKRWYSKGVTDIEEIGNGKEGINGYAKHDPESGNPLLNNPNWIPRVTELTDYVLTNPAKLSNYEGKYNSDPTKAKEYDDKTITPERKSLFRVPINQQEGDPTFDAWNIKRSSQENNRLKTGGGYVL